MIDAGQVQERIVIQEFLTGLTVDFPLSEDMSVGDIQSRVYDHFEFIRIESWL